MICKRTRRIATETRFSARTAIHGPALRPIAIGAHRGGDIPASIVAIVVGRTARIQSQRAAIGIEITVGDRSRRAAHRRQPIILAEVGIGGAGGAAVLANAREAAQPIILDARAVLHRSVVAARETGHAVRPRFPRILELPRAASAAIRPVGLRHMDQVALAIIRKAARIVRRLFAGEPFPVIGIGRL